MSLVTETVNFLNRGMDEAIPHSTIGRRGGGKKGKLKQAHQFDKQKDAEKKAKEIGGQAVQNIKDGKWFALLWKEEVELEEQFKGFRFSIGNEKPSTYSEKDIDEFLDNPNTSADNLPKWLANGIMTTLGAKNIKGKVTDAMIKVLEKIKAGKIKEIIMTPAGKMGKPDAGYSSQTEPKLDPKYFK